MQKGIYICFMSLSVWVIQSQTVMSPEDRQPLNLMDSLSFFGRQMVMAPTESERRDVQLLFDSLLQVVLYEEDIWTRDFRHVRNLSVVDGPDRTFRIFTYLLPLKGGRNKYYGYLLVPDEDGFWEAIRLRDNSYDMNMPDYDIGDVDNWYGALYYDMVSVKKDNQVYYTLIGFRPDLSTNNEKIIEVLWFKNGEPVFGHDIFFIEQFNDRKYYKAPRRLIMKYRNEVTAMLKYEAKRKRILMDNVTPPDAKLKGIYDQYGPDFSYNALVWGKNGWELQRDVKVYSDIDLPITKPQKLKK
jgi:hypothetical protein